MNFTITKDAAPNMYTAKNEKYEIFFKSTAEQGVNYSQIQWYRDLKTGKKYHAWRFLFKFVSLVQGFSNDLYQQSKTKEQNT